MNNPKKITELSGQQFNNTMQINTFSLFSKFCLAVIVSGVVNQNIAAQKCAYFLSMAHGSAGVLGR